MLKIEDGVIYLSKGDDASIKVSLKTASGAAYTMQTGDKLTLTARELPDKESKVVLKVESTTTTITIGHTASGAVPVGQYSADIQLTTADGHVHTIFPDYPAGDAKLKAGKAWKNLWITPEVSE